MKIHKVIISAFALNLILSASSSWAEAYRYTDDTGALHYVDDLSLVPPKYRSQLKDAKPLPQINVAPQIATPPLANPEAKPSQQEEPRKREVTSKTLEVFVTSWCPYCKKLEAFLDAKKIPYTRYDIEKDEKAHRVYKELGGRGVPLTRIGSDVVRGYNPEAILRLIE
ncbi:MAG: DUF4124 domain-containing protein [Nitrospirota bacterium]|nr:DUF4124 domain-containing protein [Nitrospirota bacterium]